MRLYVLDLSTIAVGWRDILSTMNNTTISLETLVSLSGATITSSANDNQEVVLRSYVFSLCNYTNTGIDDNDYKKLQHVFGMICNRVAACIAPESYNHADVVTAHGDVYTFALANSAGELASMRSRMSGVNDAVYRAF